ncbi:uncharacterized protein LOC135342747 isoform X4 [Halichondria panicea]|uniref:uncharacterized protein LOC135342747 isoform X4 n=1 Tax=Halichondria panicea TaxID=6063 RepID=UPI00312B765F
MLILRTQTIRHLFIMRLDCDNFLVNNRTLRILMDQQRSAYAHSEHRGVWVQRTMRAWTMRAWTTLLRTSSTLSWTTLDSEKSCGWSSRNDLKWIILSSFMALLRATLVSSTLTTSQESVGALPLFVPSLQNVTILKLHPETGDYLRDENGFCVECGVSEPGETV